MNPENKICSSQRLCTDIECKECYEKSFASSDKAKYWSKQNDKYPRDVFKSSNVKFIFDCHCGHQFNSSLNHIANNQWCPYCAHRKLCSNDCDSCFQNSFASSDKSIYWSKINKFNPREVFKSSHTKYIFDCDCGHKFQSTLDNILKGNWCSYCANKKLCSNDCDQCYIKSFASSDKSIFWSKKNTQNPRDIFKFSHNKFIFDCNCGHQFQSTLYNINANWCPYCANKKLCSNDCDQCYQKSFASYDKAIYWSKKNNKKPIEVFKSSAAKFIFDCDCGHHFESILDVISNGNWCPYCSHKKLCSNDCNSCYQNSFASSDNAIYWSKKNNQNPRYIFKSSNVKYIFDCPCGHQFQSILCDINHGNWCPYCSHKKLCSNDCDSCYQNSFASSDKAKYWSKENNINPRDIFKFSNVKYKFNWDCDHETFESPQNLRKSKAINNCRKCDSCPSCQLWLTNGYLCEYCQPKSQNKLYQKTKEMDVVKFLKDNLEYDFIHNKSVSSDCTGTHLFPDILFDCNFYHLIVEIDEHKHRGANYNCDKKRMYDIIAKLGTPCIFIRYNPDNINSDKNVLLDKINFYLNIEDIKGWNNYGFKCEYLYYE